MVITAAPEGVVVEVPLGVAEGSPSQERVLRIAAMLRDAELAGGPVTIQRRSTSARPVSFAMRRRARLRAEGTAELAS